MNQFIPMICPDKRIWDAVRVASMLDILARLKTSQHLECNISMISARFIVDVGDALWTVF